MRLALSGSAKVLGASVIACMGALLYGHNCLPYGLMRFSVNIYTLKPITILQDRVMAAISSKGILGVQSAQSNPLTS